MQKILSTIFLIASILSRKSSKDSANRALNVRNSKKSYKKV